MWRNMSGEGSSERGSGWEVWGDMKDRRKKNCSDGEPGSSVSRDELEEMFGDILKPDGEDKTLSEEERLQRLRAEKLRNALYPKDR